MSRAQPCRQLNSHTLVRLHGHSLCCIHLAYILQLNTTAITMVWRELTPCKQAADGVCVPAARACINSGRASSSSSEVTWQTA